MSNEQNVIQRTIEFVKKELENAEGGHDWFHIERVWKNAKLIAKSENVSTFIVELAALLHDIADSKFHAGDENIGPEKSLAFLKSINIDKETSNHIVSIIQNISFKGGNSESSFNSNELMVVRDADRLDALGAIGIARTFNYGGYKNRKIYDPSIPPLMNITKEEYKNSDAPTLNHFYEKLLLLKNLMHTETGKKIAAKRHAFLELYLEQFYKEWNGEA